MPVIEKVDSVGAVLSAPQSLQSTLQHTNFTTQRPFNTETLYATACGEIVTFNHFTYS